MAMVNKLPKWLAGRNTGPAVHKMVAHGCEAPANQHGPPKSHHSQRNLLRGEALKGFM